MKLSKKQKKQLWIFLQVVHICLYTLSVIFILKLFVFIVTSSIITWALAMYVLQDKPQVVEKIALLMAYLPKMMALAMGGIVYIQLIRLFRVLMSKK